MSSPSNSSPGSQPRQIFSVDNLTVRLYEKSAELARDAGKIAGDYLQEILGQQGEARVILATGNSQIPFLEGFISREIDWSRITFFHLDEYLGIDGNHPASFRRYLRDRVEKWVKSAAFHYIEGDAIEPFAECDRYGQLLLEKPIDLCCLGIGENGHLAFNEPSVANFADREAIKLVKLDRATHQQLVNQRHFPGAESVPKYAFTLTIPTICAAKKIICLAPELRKATAVKQMLRGSIAPEMPASILRSQSQAILFLDKESASKLG